ncbi:hypothetical protein GCM10010330_28680 [Streptomyces tendae]|nr:hypothetical protein GCM10010330_28680 [Streptomyces tendae]
MKPFFRVGGRQEARARNTNGSAPKALSKNRLRPGDGIGNIRMSHFPPRDGVFAALENAVGGEGPRPPPSYR